MRKFNHGWTGIFLAALFLMAPLAQAAPQDAQALVKNTADTVFARLKQDQAKLKANPHLIYPLVEDVVLPHFDFEKMSQWVLGKNWRNTTEAQRKRFVDQFRNLLVRTYAKALLEYTDQTLNYLPVQADASAKKVVVRTVIEQKGSTSPIPINYAMYLKNDAWKVYDITVDNVSLVSNYRNSFASEIQQGGVDQLIAKLEDMNKKGQKGG
jgi:phospholipid transport system substrate-binding protein